MSAADVFLALGVLFASVLLADFIIRITTARQWYWRLGVTLVLVWLVGSVWLHLSFLALVGLYFLLIVALVLLRRFL